MSQISSLPRHFWALIGVGKARCHYVCSLPEFLTELLTLLSQLAGCCSSVLQDQNGITMLRSRYSVSNYGWSDKYKLRRLYHRAGTNSQYEHLECSLYICTSHISFELLQFCFAYKSTAPSLMLDCSVPVSPMTQNWFQISIDCWTSI